MQWIEELFDTVNGLHYDGVTFDFEGQMLWTSPHSAQYVNLVNLTTQYFHRKLSGSTVSVCVPFTAYLSWGRQYDYYGLAKASDYLYVMDYDVQTQIFDSQCIAKAVSPFMSTKRGIESYLNLEIEPNKLILGVPWYGREYKCIVDQMDGGVNGRFCPIKSEVARGVNCSSRVAPEIPYSTAMSRVFGLKWNITAIRWDETMKTHFVNIYSGGSAKRDDLRQIWFDDPLSLSYKYQYAKEKKLRGVGPFQFGDLIDDHSAAEKQRAKEMWSAFDTFFLQTSEQNDTLI